MASGGAYTLITSAIIFLATTISTILVTRQLTDEDYGLFAMVTVLTGLAAIFLELGLFNAVVQKQKISHEQVSTLFWINVVVGTMVALIVAFTTPLLVWTYGEPRLWPINLTLASLFVVSALGIQHRALLARRMEHGKISLVSLAASLIAAATSVIVAWFGGKYWALVALSATSKLSMVVGCGLHVPGFPGCLGVDLGFER